MNSEHVIYFESGYRDKINFFQFSDVNLMIKLWEEYNNNNSAN